MKESLCLDSLVLSSVKARSFLVKLPHFKSFYSIMLFWSFLLTKLFQEGIFQITTRLLLKTSNYIMCIQLYNISRSLIPLSNIFCLHFLKW